MSRHLLFLFLDGIGLGDDNPEFNPFARAHMPNLQSILGGKRLLGTEPVETPRATLLPLDACLGVAGLPQSASGQAVLLTGKNVPEMIGYHYGPKPDAIIAEYLRNGNLFNTLTGKGRQAALLNAYPPRYFAAIQSGRRLYSSIPLAVTSAGIPLKTADDLYRGEAISADLTAEGWHTHIGLPDTPRLSPYQAGERLAYLAKEYDFSLFEYWLSDYAGHGQDMEAACALLTTFDQALGGLLDDWDDRNDLILLTSDHGNLEDLSTRRHTSNPVPALLIGGEELRARFIVSLQETSRKRTTTLWTDPNGKANLSTVPYALTDITPAILQFLA